MTSPPSANLVQKLAQVDQFGPKRQGNLVAAFGSEEELRAASEQQLRDVLKSAPLAHTLHATIATYDGTNVVLPPKKWRGEARVEMWNRKTNKKVTTQSLPTEAVAEAWLAKRPHCERYTGQDVQLKGPDRVPDASMMTEADFLAHCQQQGSADELARLEKTLAEYSLARVAVAVGAGGSSAAPAAPPGSSLIDALSRGAGMFQQAISKKDLKSSMKDLQSTTVAAVPRMKVDPMTAAAVRARQRPKLTMAEGLVADSEDEPPTDFELLAASSNLLSRPIW